MSKFKKSLFAFFIIELTFFVIWWVYGHKVGVIVLPIFYVSFLFLMSMNIQANFYMDAIHSLSTNKVMLSFDDGPHPIHTPKILDILKKNKIRAMFFVMGKNMVAYPEIVQRMIDEGHVLGGHSVSHSPSIGFAFGKKLEDDIMSCQHMINDKLGQTNYWFRPPFGVTNPNIARVVNKFGLKVVGWNVRSFDTSITDKRILLHKIMQPIKAGSIVLLHDRLAHTSDMLPEIIDKIRYKGYEFGVLDQYDE